MIHDIDDSVGLYMGEINCFGLPHGKGIWANHSKILEGYWENGRLKLKGREINSTGMTVWEGEMKDNEPFG